jgi:DNA-binding FadR family transcriptional regulator
VPFAGRRHPEIEREVAEMFRKTRSHVAEALESKDAEGVITLRFGAEATVGFLFAIADGFAVQAISDPEVDHADALDAGREAARHLLLAG